MKIAKLYLTGKGVSMHKIVSISFLLVGFYLLIWSFIARFPSWWAVSIVGGVYIFLSLYVILRWLDRRWKMKQKQEIQKTHYEICPAKIYYGKHATGVVLLHNGCVEFHGEKADAEKILKSQESDENCF